MTMTSVLGHLMSLDFVEQYKSWRSCAPLELFDAPIRKTVSAELAPVKANLQAEARSCSDLIIWTDCDREGENIGLEVLEVCREANPRIRPRRALFSSLSGPYGRLWRARHTPFPF